ncbi:hypothetical protein ABIE65_000604 [Constrictibacter sp. MBR-5]|jgi:hypothetical protein|uniref:hypothetical protein n=1 Tax=Constrictibacter sp. MBR-5 TaxID=3156467 RepID=UPI00339B1A3E
MQIPPSSNLFVALGAFGGTPPSTKTAPTTQAAQHVAQPTAPTRSVQTVAAAPNQGVAAMQHGAPTANLPRGSLLNIKV